MEYPHSTRETVALTIRVPLAVEEHVRMYALARHITVADVVTHLLERWRFDGGVTPLTSHPCPDLIDLALRCRQQYPPIPSDLRLAHLYFFHTGEYGYVKIGQSLCPETRRLEVQTGCMFPLRLLAKICVEDAKGCEKFLHRYLKDVHMSGEWFYIPDALCKVFLRTLLAGG